MQPVEQYLKAVESWLARPENAEIHEGLRGSLKGNIANLRATIVYRENDMARVVAQSEKALVHLPQSLLDQRSIAALNLGSAYIEEGRFDASERALEQALIESRAGEQPYIQLRVLSTLAWRYRLDGKLFLAADKFKQALALVEQYEGQGKRLLADLVFAGLSQITYEWNDLAAAESYLKKALRQEEMSGLVAAWQNQVTLLRLRLAQADLEGAAQAVETAVQLIMSEPHPENQPLLLAWQAYYYCQIDEMNPALHYAELAYDRLGQITKPSTDLSLFVTNTFAQMLIRQNANRQAEALQLLDTARQTAEKHHRTAALITINTLSSLALQKLGRIDSAVTMLRQALESAEIGGYIRLFLDIGSAIVPILSACPPTAYRDCLLDAFSTQFDRAKSSTKASLVEPLTAREYDTLRLLASERTIPEIAAELSVAISTIRTYCKRIYAKLNVHSRAGAVYKARSFGLLGLERE